MSTSTGHNQDDRQQNLKLMLRIGVSVLILAAAVASACIVMVPAGQAEVITRFGNPIRVITEPGLAWKLPVPLESSIPIDLRLLTTSTGLQDVGTRDGLRVLVQAYVAWQVPSDPKGVQQFLKSVRNQPDEAARQLRTYVNDALHNISSNFDLADLVNTDAQKVHLDAYEDELRARVAPPMLQVYGIAVRQIGIERMTLPDDTLTATVERMRAERETVAKERTADGLQKAAAIRADADKEAREVVAEATEKAARTVANSQQAAASIHDKAYRSDPTLYETLRSLDTISNIVGKNTSIVIRTDAAPFRVLVDGPPNVSNSGGRQTAAAPAPAAADAKPAAPTQTPQTPQAQTPAAARATAPQKAPVPTKDVTTSKDAKKP